MKVETGPVKVTTCDESTTLVTPDPPRPQETRRLTPSPSTPPDALSTPRLVLSLLHPCVLVLGVSRLQTPFLSMSSRRDLCLTRRAHSYIEVGSLQTQDRSLSLALLPGESWVGNREITCLMSLRNLTSVSML